MATKPYLLFPFYIYPDADWQTLAKLASKQNAIAVINPASGSVSTTDPKYVSGVQMLQAAGLTVLGYIATGGGAVSSSDIDVQMGYYQSEYVVSGIFFDQMSPSASQISYYVGLAQLARNHGFSVTVGNAGVPVDSGYTNVFTILCTYENAGLPSITQIQEACPIQGQKYAIICHDVQSVSEQYVLSISHYVAYCFFTDKSEPNPYNALPSYFAQEMSLLQYSTASSIARTVVLFVTFVALAVVSLRYVLG